MGDDVFRGESFRDRLQGFVLDAVSGRRTDWRARLALPILDALSRLYGLGLALRRAAYSSGLAVRLEAELPVISVGNITAGGTGKTPLVEYLARRLLESGRKPAILSRGYGQPVSRPHAERAGATDESLVLKENLPHVPLMLGASRLVSARRARDEHGADVCVCDDAFQYLALARDLDIVAIDATLPFGFGHLLPRGLLREPLDALKRAGVFVVTRSDLIDPDELKRLVQRLMSYSREAPVVLSRHRPGELRGHVVENRKPLSELSGRRVAAFSAIGNPQAFGMTLRSLGAEIVYARRFPDHHVFTDEELSGIGLEARRRDAELVVVTQKDSVKVKRDPGWPMPLYYLSVDLEITDGEEALWQAVAAALAAGDARARRASAAPGAGAPRASEAASPAARSVEREEGLPEGYCQKELRVLGEPGSAVRCPYPTSQCPYRPQCPVHDASGRTKESGSGSA